MIIRFLAGAALLCILYISFFPVAALLSKGAVLEEFLSAANNGDSEVIEERINFEALRMNLIRTLETKTQNVRSGPGRIRIGPEPDKVEKVVNYYIRPENVDLALQIKEIIFPQIQERDFIRDTGLIFPFGFKITVGYPVGNNMQNLGPEPPTSPLLKITFHFYLEGGRWVISNADIPLFMVPPDVQDLSPEAYFEKKI